MGAVGIVEARVKFAADDAQGLAQQVASSVRWFKAGSRLTATCNFFVDRSRMVIVVGAQERAGDVDKALAYGLAWSGDRDLVLVLPSGREVPTLRRAAFLATHIRVFSHGGELVEHPVPAERTVIDQLDDPLVTKGPRSRHPLDVGGRAGRMGGQPSRPAHRASAELSVVALPGADGAELQPDVLINLIG